MTSVKPTNLSLLYSIYWPTSRTKANLATDREMYWLPGYFQYMYMYIGELAETWTQSWLTQTSHQEWWYQESHCWTLLNDWDSAECVTYSTNYQQWLTKESWYANFQQTMDGLKETIKQQLTNHCKLQTDQQGSKNPLARRPGLAQSDVGLPGKVHSVPDGLVEFFLSLYFLILHK